MYCERENNGDTRICVSRKLVIATHPLIFPLIFFLAAPFIYSLHLFFSDENKDSGERKEKEKKIREREGFARRKLTTRCTRFSAAGVTMERKVVSVLRNAER